MDSEPLMNDVQAIVWKLYFGEEEDTQYRKDYHHEEEESADLDKGKQCHLKSVQNFAELLEALDHLEDS